MTEKPDTPDFAALAREYLDLWEDQLAAMAGDTALAEQSARFFQAMGGTDTAANPMANPMANPAATAQMAAMAQQFMTLAGLAAGGKVNDGDPANNPALSNAARPAAPAAASGDGAQQLAELSSRLAALEERLDRLEAGSGGARNSAKPAAKKRSAAGKRAKPKPKKD